jgi:hypothetical protein
VIIGFAKLLKKRGFVKLRNEWPSKEATVSAVVEAKMAKDPRPEHPGPREGSAPVSAALIDVLIRGLETAKQRIDDGSTTELKKWCTWAYGLPGGGFCPLCYHE